MSISHRSLPLSLQRLFLSHPRVESTSGAGGARSSHGFTLVELLVVVAIIVLLIAVLFPVFGKVRQNARSASCLVNERTIANAMSTYTQDNAGRLTSPRTDSGSSLPGGTLNTWVKASGSGVLNGEETEKSLQNGALWQYMDANPRGYRSPNDPTERVRSYSINAYVGNVQCPDDTQCGTGLIDFPDGVDNLATPVMSKIPQPSSTLCAIVEEYYQGFNFQGWLINWEDPEWIDPPAFWDEGRVNVSFMDGSTRTLNIFSERFINEATAVGVSYVEPNPAGAWFAMRQYLLPGRCDL
ncbi:MAG: type II secretion system protein [Phycisphaerae bacterium]|nr:type II secretion system protein [Phycisphaerae bacterium]